MSTVSNLKRKFGVAANKGSIKVKKHSPEILLGVGIISGVGAAIMACKATPKIYDVLDEAAEAKEIVRNHVEENGYTEEYTKEDEAKDKTIISVKATVDIIKVYGPAIGLGLFSITCILASHNVLRKRNAALAMAYEIAQHGFRGYRDRVIERFGEEIDKELIFGVREREIEEETVDKNGKKKIVKKKERTFEPPHAGLSTYARCFDAQSPYWEKDPAYNLAFLKTQQQYCNDLLRTNGYLFLNDVYDILGFDRIQAGQLVGWVYDPDGSKHGENWPKDKPWDNYIDFNIYEITDEASRRFVNGVEPCVWLDFNVDGDILRLI